MTDPSKPNEGEKAPEKKLPVKKEELKDLTVEPGKEKDIVGGGGGSPSKPRTPCDYTCAAC